MHSSRSVKQWDTHEARKNRYALPLHCVRAKYGPTDRRDRHQQLQQLQNKSPLFYRKPSGSAKRRQPVREGTRRCPWSCNGASERTPRLPDQVSSPFVEQSCAAAPKCIAH